MGTGGVLDALGIVVHAYVGGGDGKVARRCRTPCRAVKYIHHMPHGSAGGETYGHRVKVKRRNVQVYTLVPTVAGIFSVTVRIGEADAIVITLPIPHIGVA